MLPGPPPKPKKQKKLSVAPSFDQVGKEATFTGIKICSKKGFSVIFLHSGLLNVEILTSRSNVFKELFEQNLVNDFSCKIASMYHVLVYRGLGMFLCLGGLLFANCVR